MIKFVPAGKPADEAEALFMAALAAAPAEVREKFDLIIKSEKVVTINVVENQPMVLIGAYDIDTIDIRDFDNLRNTDPVFTKNGAMLHEVYEIAMKQLFDKKRPEAHSDGKQVEDATYGLTRVSEKIDDIGGAESKKITIIWKKEDGTEITAIVICKGGNKPTAIIRK